MESAGLEIYSNLLSEIAINTLGNIGFQVETVMNTWKNTKNTNNNIHKMTSKSAPERRWDHLRTPLELGISFGALFGIDFITF